MVVSDAEADALARVVMSDLRYLGTGWHAPDIDEDVLRRDSAILRRLLIDNGGMLQRLRRQLGLRGEPRVTAIDVTELKGRVDLAVAGGGSVGEWEFRSIMAWEDPNAPSVDFPEPTELVLSRFLDSACVLLDDTLVRRRHLIKYVANKLGGVHFDTTRNPGRGTNQQEVLGFAALDEVREQFSVRQLPSVYFELLSIGQALLQSPGVQELIPQDT